EEAGAPRPDVRGSGRLRADPRARSPDPDRAGAPRAGRAGRVRRGPRGRHHRDAAPAPLVQRVPARVVPRRLRPQRGPRLRYDPARSDLDAALADAAERAVADLADGMVVGLGTGSAATAAVRAIGRRVREGLRIAGVPTSARTEALARELGIPLA